MKKELKMNTNPSYKTFNNLAFGFSIIELDIKDYTNWLVSNFLRVFYRITWGTISFKLPHCYRWKCFTHKMIIYNSKRYESFINAVENQINNDRYVYLCVNEKYIPNRPHYNKNNYLHDIYIYGYDNDNENFLTAGYNLSGHFSQQKISYESVFLAQKNKLLKNIFFAFSIIDDFKYNSVNVKKVKIQIFRHFFSINACYGIKIYDWTIKHYKSHKTIDFTYPSLICEHISIINNLNVLGYNIDCKHLIELSDKLMNLTIKYNLTFDENIINNLISLINQIKAEEIVVFKSFFSQNKYIYTLYRLKFKKYLL